MVDYSPRKPAPVAPATTLAHALDVTDSTPPPTPVPARVDRNVRQRKAPKLRPEDVQNFVANIFNGGLHAKRVLALAAGAVGVVHSASLAIAAIGRGLAQARGLIPKHAIKQVDRLLSNEGIELDEVLPLWVGFVLAARSEVLVTLDWTEFDADDHATLCVNLVTTHGRATPLVWKTVKKSSLKNRRNDYEDALLERFHDMLPMGVKVTLLADRGFGDQKLYALLTEWQFDFVIRFRGCITVHEQDGSKFTASALVPNNGRPKLYKDVFVTEDRTPVAGVMCVKQKGMKDAWHLATSHRDLTAAQLMKLYGRRFTTEENFRDTKDSRFGLGLSATHVGDCNRRDRLLLLAALAEALLTLLGGAAEQVGLDRFLKVNTAKSRQHSLFKQGLHWYGSIPEMPEEWLLPLMQAFGKIVEEHPFFSKILGII